MPFYHRAPGGRGPLLPRPPLAAGGGPTAQPGSPLPLSSPGGQAGGPREVGYAVVDLETTGLSPAGDEILEIGLVLADAAGAVERSWTTLINPGPGADGEIEVGPTFIHGIVADDLLGAPSLDDVADLLVRDLAGRAVVAHNARFDVGFLTQALGLRGRLDRGAWIPRVCTMEWSRHYIETPSRRLVTCCEVSGVEIGRHHSALDDALAATGLLRHYMAVGRERGDSPLAWDRALGEAAAFTGWHWDASAARAQEQLLVPRRGAGVLRETTAQPGSAR